MQSYPESDSLPMIKSLFSAAPPVTCLEKQPDKYNDGTRLIRIGRGEMSNNSGAEILVVDDDAISRQVLAKLLTAAGYKCHVCKDGSEALEAVSAHTPSVLLFFFELRGVELRQRIKPSRQ